MTLETPVFLEAVSGDDVIPFSARQLRTIADAVWKTEGVIGAGDLLPTVRSGGANMSVDIAAGMCVITGESVAAQGKYVVRSTSTINLPINAAPATGSRTDLIVARIYDKQADGGTSYGWGIVVLPGTTTLPASAVEIGRVTVPSGATSIAAGNISTTTRQYAATGAAVTNRPVYSQQAGNPPFNTTGTYTDFTSAAWAPLAFTFPPSGQVFVTVSADIYNLNTDASTVHATWRVSSGAATFPGSAALSSGGGRLSGSRRTLLTGAAGVACVLTPQWRISSGTASDSSIANGVLVVEFVA